MADSREMLKIACAALEDKKAFDIKIIDISRISTLCDYIVIADEQIKNRFRHSAIMLRTICTKLDIPTREWRDILKVDGFCWIIMI